MAMPRILKNKDCRNDNKYNRHPYITHTPQLHKDIVMCEMCMYVCDEHAIILLSLPIST